ncbi:MAG: prepilin peptidase [Deltaproteobacteria bacterium]|nr:prepilin peptidase [Deltaproteobacteria bacterium]
MPYNLILIVPFVLGAVVGSFLNVCIYRIPAGRSIVFPGSSCSSCGQAIAFYDNIPILSYLLLRGRCRRCAASFSFQYPLVEVLSAVFATALFIRSGASVETLVYFVFVSALIVITFIDLELRIIPDVISLPGIPLGFAASFVLPAMNWLDSVIGALAGGGILLAIAVAYYAVAKKEGMGGGDVKLLAMIGAFIGWQGVLMTLLLASFSGSIIGLAMMLIYGKDSKYAIPFGPFLAGGALAYLFVGSRLIAWYFTVSGF